MSGPILAQADAVMGQDVYDALPHECRQADGRTHVVGKHKKGAGIGQQPAMQCQPIQASRHPVLADPKMDISARIVAGTDGRHAGNLGEVRGGQVGRAAHQLGDRAG